jgi:acetoin utilization deacetylase AcuC-like enzyme
MLRLYTHDACLAHQPGAGHPESPARLASVLHALDHDHFAALDRCEAPRATRAMLERAHDADYVARIFALAEECARNGASLHVDADTVLAPATLEAALRAAGAVVAAVDAVLDGACRRAFCAVRPPGHHATATQAMGFCIFNSVAIGAAHALAAHGLKRVAIIDFDVHHGNGTQDIAAREPRLLYLSTHQSPLYPGTGAASEHGRGNVFNAPLPPGTGSEEFRATWHELLLPRLAAFRPQLLLVSAGFDAHRLDPLADMNLGSEDFAWLGAELTTLADAHASGRLVSALEGGYSLSALAAAVPAYLAAQLD